MAANFRQGEILDIARSEGKVTVEALAQRFAVTLQTIRRDLADLAEAGKLQRVHGGAVVPSGVTNIAYRERRRLNEGAKAAIARLCATHIPDNSAVFLNIGTTTEAVARELLGHANLTVVTNNMNVANILAESPSCEVVVTGGVLRQADGGLVGDLAVRMVERFKLDLAVVGTSALDDEGELLDFDLAEVEVTRAIIRNSRRSFLVADRSKLSRGAPVRVASLADLDAVFTDGLPEGLRRQCREWGTAVLEAPMHPADQDRARPSASRTARFG